MVNIEKILRKKNKTNTTLLGCKVPVYYKNKLVELNISFTSFVLEALRETFGEEKPLINEQRKLGGKDEQTTNKDEGKEF